MPAITEAALRQALESYIDPVIGRGLGEAGVLRSVTLKDGRARVAIELGFPCDGYRQTLIDGVRAHLSTVAQVEADVALTWAVQSHAVQAKLQPLPNVLRCARTPSISVCR